MSVKIYNGFRFLSSDLGEVFDLLTSMRPGFSAVQYDETAQWTAKTAARIIDRRTLGLPQEAKQGSSPLWQALGELRDRQGEIRKTGYRDPEVDFSFSMTVLPFQGRIYGMAITERPRLREFFAQDSGAEDFSYWNGTDGPDDMADCEWSARGAIWDGILRQDPGGRPGACGLNFEALPDFVFPKVEDVVAAIPAIADRARRHACERVADRHFKTLIGGMDLAENPSAHMSLALKALDYTRSGEGAAEVDAEALSIADILSDPIDSAMLTGTTPAHEP